MLSDIEIAQAAKMQPITEIAAKLGLQGEDVIPYGHYKAKLTTTCWPRPTSPRASWSWSPPSAPPRPAKARPPPRVGLADAMNALGKKTMLVPA